MPTNIPTMRSLMRDPLYRAYMKRIPPAHNANRAGSGDPWQIWVNRGKGRWGTAFRETYADAWRVFVHHFRAEDDRDVSIISRRVFYAPPGEWYDQKVRRPRRPTPDNKATSHIVIEPRWRQTWFWEGVDLHWCGRCRRPVYWQPLFPDHHALRRLPAVSEEDNYRCIICGVRWVTTPSIDRMER